MLTDTTSEAPTEHARPLVIDSLTFLDDCFSFTPEQFSGVFPPPSEESIDSAVRSGLSAGNVTLAHGDDFALTLSNIERFDAAVRASGGRLSKVRTVADIDRAVDEGSVGVIYGLQNSAMVGADASRVATLAERGVRIVQLTYNDQNQVGSGSLARVDSGLSDFGREVVREIRANDLILDLSHGSYRLTMDVIAGSSADRPPCITHTGCASIADVPRNKVDEEMKGIADLGGYVGVYLMPFLAPGREFTYDDLFAHIDHAVNVCGEDVVGIGTDHGVCDVHDMDAAMRRYGDVVRYRQLKSVSAPGEDPHLSPYPRDFRGVEQYRDIDAAMRRNGYKSSRIEKILGGNFYAYAARIWGGA